MTRRDPFLSPDEDCAPLIASPSFWAAVLFFWTLVFFFGALLC